MDGRRFKDRVDAAGQLIKLLGSFFKGDEVVVYALPRGGVVLGAQIAKKLNAPLDLIITRKIRHPDYPEYAIGAITQNGHRVLNKAEVANISRQLLSGEIARQRQEARRRRAVYLAGRPPIPCQGKIAILVDDGIATGLTLKAAIKELKIHFHPRKIIVAVPVAPKEIVDQLMSERIEVLAVIIDQDFLGSIGAYYEDFSPVEDRQVIEIMRKANFQKIN